MSPVYTSHVDSSSAYIGVPSDSEVSNAHDETQDVKVDEILSG